MAPSASDARIRLLNAALADQIAAGEVVERPASVIKETVENAIDAGATRVDVELEDGGLTSIRVVDNGDGIHPEDLVMAITRHGTSKIRGPEDLVDILTLGFRGEALASMAAVARVTLRSRQAGAAVGAEIHAVPGETPRPVPVGMPVGTQIEIRGLFANVPARRKFMRSEATEVGHCAETLLRLALIHPEVHLTLRHQKRELLSLPATSLAERVVHVLERRASGPFFAIEGEEDQTRVQLWLAAPRRAIQGRGGLYVVTRRRVVRERNLSQIVSQALGDHLASGSSPIGALIVEPPPAGVDVNVHPQKSEVRFSDPQRVYAAVRRVLARALERAPWVLAGAGPAGVADEDVPSDSMSEETGPASALTRWAAQTPEPEAPSLRGQEVDEDEARGEGRGGQGRRGPSPARSGLAGRASDGSSIARDAPRGIRAPLGFRFDREGDADEIDAPRARRVGDDDDEARDNEDRDDEARDDEDRDEEVGEDRYARGERPTRAKPRGYRLSTRALTDDYGAHKREVKVAAGELRQAREPDPPADPPAAEGRARAIGPLFAGVPGSARAVDPDDDDDLEDPAIDDALAADDDEAAGEASGERASAPRLLTCLPGPIAVFREGEAILAVDLRQLRSHLVYQRLLRDLKASRRLAVQGLLSPVVVRRIADEVRLFVAARDEMLALGIDLDAFGDDAVVVRGVPAHLRGCLDDADINDLIARVVPWLRLRAGDRERAGPQQLLAAIAATRGPDPAPRLARRWIAELTQGGESLAAVPGVRRWSASELLGSA